MLSDILKNSKPLSDRELKELLTKVEGGDIEARNSVLKGYYRFIYKLAANKARGNEQDLNEFFQVGVLALLTAINRTHLVMTVGLIRKIYYYTVADAIDKAKKSDDEAGIISDYNSNRNIKVLRSDNITMIDDSKIIYKDID